MGFESMSEAIMKRRMMMGCLPALLLAGCGGDETEQVTFSLIHKANGPLGDPDDRTSRSFVLRDQSALTAIWREANRSDLTNSPAPQVDFSRRTVVAVYLGWRSNGCFDIKPLSVWRTGRHVVFEYTELTDRGPCGGGCTTAVTNVFGFYALDVVDVEVEVRGGVEPGC